MGEFIIILSEKVKTRWNNFNKEWFIEKGYTYTGYRDEVEVFTKDLQPNSSVKILIACDDCGKQTQKTFGEYNEIISNHGGYWCSSCRSMHYINEEKTIYKTDIEIANMLKDIEDSKKYSICTKTKLLFKCKYCGTEYLKEPILVKQAKSNLCPCCSDGFSFNNKYIYSALLQSNVNFEKEFSDKDCYIFINNKKRKVYFDFKVIVNNKIYFIEADGRQHSNGCEHFKTSIEEQKDIDCKKDELANKLGNIIRIDCTDFTNVDLRIQEQLKFKFKDIIDFKNVDWNKCYEFAKGTMFVEVCNLIKEGLAGQSVIKKLGVSKSYVTTCIRKGNETGILNYETIFQKKKNKKEKAKELFDNGEYDLNVIKDKLNMKDIGTVKSYFKELYEETKDKLYLITKEKYYYCIEDNIYYTRTSLARILDKTEYNVRKGIENSIRVNSKYYGKTYIYKTTQEVYSEYRKDKTINIVEV